MLPTTQEYKISLMIGQDSFRTLENIEVVPNPNYPDEPWYSTGGLAIVFKIKMGEKLYALKCFYNEANERQERLGLIANYLKQNPAPYLVDFTYLDNEIFVETANGGEGYPVLLMEWVEGKTLDNYLEEVCQQQNKPALQNLYFQFCNLAWWLQQQPIAHGDLKHDNLMVTPDGKLKMIDYDGMFVPALHGRKANEQGSPCYQHPKRDAQYFNERLDDFSLLILQITLLALQNEPSLFKAHYNGDGILLKDTDYPNFAHSPIKTLLWRLNDVKIPLLLSQLQSNLNYINAIDLMPLLQDLGWINWLVDGQKDNKLALERQRLKDLVLGDERWMKFFINQISRYYPLNEKLIEKFKSKWNWREYDGLSSNLNLLWTFELIEKYQNQWHFYDLGMNSALPWTIELIEEYKDKWYWGCQQGEFYAEERGLTSVIPITVEIIEKYNHREDFTDFLSDRRDFPWSIELIEICIDKWNWFKLSKNIDLPWTIDLIEKYEDKWHFDGLSSNSGLPWTIELIEKYEDEWAWYNLSENIGLPWTIELLEKYEDKWYFDGLSRNSSLPWTIELIEKYEDDWLWSLCGNSGLPWTIKMIEKYEDKLENWGKEGFSTNSGLPWTIELIEKYEDKWDWDGLNDNLSLPWTVELLEKYVNKWDWEYSLSKSSGMRWTVEMIEKFEHKWSWTRLSGNDSLPWTLELLEKYKNKWGSWINNNEGIYDKVLLPQLDDEFIDEIMTEITKINP